MVYNYYKPNNEWIKVGGLFPKVKFAWMLNVASCFSDASEGKEKVISSLGAFLGES